MALSTKERKIFNSIVVGSEHNPTEPEFPPTGPKFPATPTYRIEVPGFTNVWLKDESVNEFSGTHKDRLAWEVVVLYRNFLLAKDRGQLEGDLPTFSIISSGSAALALGLTLRHFGLPKIKVLVDKGILGETRDSIEGSHCELYTTDLSERELMAEDILERTDNKDGFDLTSHSGIGFEIGNYDWMSYEILNEKPEYCFIPYGTGTIYSKLMVINKLEAYGRKDPRYKGPEGGLPACNFIGATTHDPNSKADKLYAPHLPYYRVGHDWIRFYRMSGLCGPQSAIHDIEEEFLGDALVIAEEQNITTEASGISGLAMLLQFKDNIPKDKRILIVNTGKTKLST